MYEARTQNCDPEIHEEYISYMIHPFPFHIIYSHVHTVSLCLKKRVSLYSDDNFVKS